MNRTHPASHFLLAAPSSGSGKTTLTLGLLRALGKQGLRVQPFKCGPDYIDPLHHATAAGVQSLNLDTFMASATHVRETYQRYASRADVAVTEGVMGLFDGADRMQGSSAAIAELLGIPVVLVVNAKAMAYSVAPLLYGFKHFCSGIRLAGVIFNFVSSESHYRFLREACQDVGVEPLGYLPPNPAFSIPSRHLGLHISDEIAYEPIIQAIAKAIPETVDLPRLLEITRVEHRTERMALPSIASRQASRTSLRISVARDEAFAFAYPQNLDVLSNFGELTFFSPIHDTALPATDLLYLPGGYPELHAPALSQHVVMRESIRQYCLAGGLTYAECGGMMYLGQTIEDNQGVSFPMVGLFNIDTSMREAKMTLGYRVIQWNKLSLKGHEFHYSTLRERRPLSTVAAVTNAKGVAVDTKLYRVQNTFASYLHLYWGEKPEFIQQLLQAAQASEPTL